MARPLRIEYAGALYHVTSRGDGQEAVFLNDGDRRMFLTVVDEVCERFNWAVHAYCLMDNHYHLLVETVEGNLSKGMRQLNGVYTQRFNRSHSRVGHVFQGRYKAILVERESYLLELARYVVLNPVRAGRVRSAKDWPWSSYRATAGQSSGEQWLQTEWLLSTFARQKGKARNLYKAFVAEGKDQPSPWEQLRNQVYIGSEEFVETMREHQDAEKDLSEIPAKQRRGVVKKLEYFSGNYSDRDEAIVAAHGSGAYTMREIGDHFGIHYSYVSRIISRRRRKATGKT